MPTEVPGRPRSVKVNLSRRLVSLIATTIIVSGLVLSFTVSVETLSKFNQVEATQLSDSLGRLNDAVTARLDSLASKNGDWSNWDDSYNYILGRNGEFVQTNLTNNALIQLDVTGMIFYSADRDLINAKFVNLATHDEKVVPADLAKRLTSASLLDFTKGNNNRGIIEDGQLEYLVSARPILTSDGSGPAAGSLVFLRQLDSDLISALAKTTHLEVSGYRYNSPKLPSDIVAIKDQLLTSSQLQVRVSNKLTSGYSVVIDAITNRPIFIWQINLPRTVYALGFQTVETFIIYFSVVGAVSGLILLALLRNSILARLVRYQEALERIRQTGDLNELVPISRNDEITSVGNVINDFIIKFRNTLAALTKEHDKATTIIQSMGEGLIVLDRDLRVLTINRAAEQLLELVSGSVVGKSWTDLLTVYDGDKKISHDHRSVVKALKTNQLIRTRIEDNRYFETHTGKRFPAVSVTTPFHGEGVEGVVVIFRDVTEEKDTRRKIESEVKDRTAALDEAKARLVSSINSLPVGFIMTDVNENILLINKNAQNLFSFMSDSPEDIPVVTVDTISTNLQGGADLVKEIGKVMKTQKLQEIKEVSINDVDIEVYLSPVLFRKDVIGVVIVLVDVTASKQLSKAKDDFLSIASHELRTPLTAIMGNASMIEQYYAKKINDKDLWSMIDDMKTASVRLIEMVNDFLNLSRLEQHRITFTTSEVELGKVINAVVKELGSTVKKEVKLTVEKLPAVTIETDPDRLKEVLSNLVSNAIKYTEQGTIKVKLTPEKDDKVRILVTDTGLGIAANSQRLLFQKFQQAGQNQLTRDPRQSSGLGLYIAKLLITQMGGSVGLAKSELGQGSTFYIELTTKKTGRLNKKA